MPPKKQGPRDTSMDDARLVEWLADELRQFVDWLDDFPMSKPSLGDMRMIANRVEKLLDAIAHTAG